MYTEFPNYVHRKNFDYHYIFNENEIFDIQFCKKLKQFSTAINGEIVIFELLIPDETKQFVKNDKISVLNDSSDLISSFFELKENINGTLIYYSSFNFFINDRSNEWEIYCSSTYNLIIASCMRNVNKLFVQYFNPYEKNTIRNKLEESAITLNDDARNKFIEMICANYNFSNPYADAGL